MDIKELVGQNVKAIRKNLKLSQAEAAEAVGLSRVSVTSIETGRTSVTLDNLFAFSVAFKVPVTRFFDGIESDEDSIEYINLKYRMLEMEYKKLQRKHEKLVNGLSELIKEG